MSILLNNSQIKSNLMHCECRQVLSPAVAVPNGGVCLLESSSGLCPQWDGAVALWGERCPSGAFAFFPSWNREL